MDTLNTKPTLLVCPVEEVTFTPPYGLSELKPLTNHLSANKQPTKNEFFQRGTLLSDGRLDLCKQGLGIMGGKSVADALHLNDFVHALLLGTNGLGDEGLKHISQLLKKNQTVETLYLGCNRITAQGLATLCDSLNESQVKALWLKRNPLGDTGAEVLAEFLEHDQNIQTLDLVHTQISITGLNRLASVLAEKKARSEESLKWLYLSGNAFDDRALPAIISLIQDSGLTGLHLSANHLGDQGASALASFLKKMVATSQTISLKALTLASNNIGSNAAIELIHAAASSSIELLDLGYSPSSKALGTKNNRLGDQGVEEIVDVLAESETIRVLILDGNDITDKGAQALLSMYKKSSNLYRLRTGHRIDQELKELSKKKNPSIKPVFNKDALHIQSVYR